MLSLDTLHRAALTWRRVLRELSKYGTLSYGTVLLSVELQRIVLRQQQPSSADTH